MVPPNDNFADRITLPGITGVATGTNRGASMEVGEPQPHADSSRSVWYQWTAPADGQVRFTVSGLNAFNISTRTYLGGTTLATLTNGPSTIANQSLVSMVRDVTAGMIIYLPVAAFGAGAVGGDFTVSWNADFPQPPNDDFANAFNLVGDSTGGHAYNMTATKESGEPNHAGNAGGGSLWWTWTAPRSGTATLVVHGQAMNVLAAVYTGAAVDGLVPLTSGTGASVTNSFVVAEGTDYHIAIDGLNGATGYFDFDITLEDIVPEPDFVTWAFSNEGLSGTLLGDAGVDYIIQFSTNLVHWQNLITPTNDNGGVDFSVEPTADPVYFLRSSYTP